MYLTGRRAGQQQKPGALYINALSTEISSQLYANS